MAETQAIVGYGVVLKKETAPSAGTYADYGLEITSAAPPGMSRSAIDATHMASPDGYKEMIFGLKETKPFNIEVNWNPANTGAYQALMEGDALNWQILFPDNSTATVKAGITDVSPAAATPDGKLSCTFTFTPTGKATWA